MTALPRPFRRSRWLAAASLLAMLAVTSSAAAAPGTIGTTTIALDGAVAASLREQGVTVRADGSAKAGERQIALPVASGVLGGGAALVQRGGVTFRHRADGRLRAVTLTRWQARVRAGRTTITALSGGKRRTILTAEVVPWRLEIGVTAGTVRLRATKVALTRSGARLLRTRLQLEKLGAGTLGRLSIVAVVRSGGGQSGGGGGGNVPDPGPGGGPTTPGCKVNSSGTITPAAAPPARPGSAVDVASATIVWRPRDSFIRYVSSGEGPTASNGAAAGAPEVLPGSPAALTYSFGFELKGSSWYDAASDTAELLGRGTVRFRYSDHGIDITVKDPEIELHGATSQAIFVLGGDACTQLGDVRGEMLDLAPAAPTIAGATRDYGQIPAKITATGADMFSGFYLPGDAWGSIAVTFTPGS